MRLTVNPNFEREIQAEVEYQTGVARVAQEVAKTAKAIAPEGPTKFYRHSIDVELVGDEWVVRTTDFAGHLVEWGSVNNPVYAPLRRAVLMNGLRLHEIPKPS